MSPKVSCVYDTYLEKTHLKNYCHVTKVRKSVHITSSEIIITIRVNHQNVNYNKNFLKKPSHKSLLKIEKILEN